MITAPMVIEQGSLAIPSNATVTLNGILEVDGLGLVSRWPRQPFWISAGISWEAPANADQFTPLGTIVFTSNAGINAPPQESRPCRPTSAPFKRVLSTILLMGRSV